VARRVLRVSEEELRAAVVAFGGEELLRELEAALPLAARDGRGRLTVEVLAEEGRLILLLDEEKLAERMEEAAKLLRSWARGKRGREKKRGRWSRRAGAAPSAP
jgi:hypothetical protein